VAGKDSFLSKTFVKTKPSILNLAFCGNRLPVVLAFGGKLPYHFHSSWLGIEQSPARQFDKT
jgi:hypothetical protein